MTHFDSDLNLTLENRSIPLGSRWLHLPTNTVYILRAITDPRTLVPTRYMYNKKTDQSLFEVNPSEWKPYAPRS